MTPPPDDTQLLALVGSVIKTEAEALLSLSKNPDPAFVDAARLIGSCTGHCIVSGVGKSGHIGRKIAATFSSTGTPAFFIHPTEASHGDLGMIGVDACVLALSNSGETRELRDLIGHCHDQDIPLVAITRNRDSFLGRHAKVVLTLPSAPEACPNGLAPTTSTTLALAMGDALAIAIMGLNGFSREDFGQHHPGGTLGLSLQKVSTYLLENTDPVPVVTEQARGKQIIQAITEGRQGCIAVVNSKGNFTGMITDGDLRRAMEDDFFAKTAAQIMTTNPATAKTHQRMKELIHVMTTRRIANLFIIEEQKPVGLIHIKDLMEQGYV